MIRCKLYTGIILLFLYVSIISSFGQTYYSYQSGKWNTASSWTTDPSGSLSVNAAIPGVGSNVVILNGRTIKIAAGDPSVTVSSLVVNLGGYIDLTTTSGHNFGTVSGQGTIRISSGNFPGGAYGNFIAAGGGTVEYYNFTGNLPITQTTYNNLLLSKTDGTNYTYTLASDITTNGNFILQNTFVGNTLLLNIGNSGVTRNLTVYGKLENGLNCSIRVGVAAATSVIHNIILYGDFINNGSSRFTTQASPFVNLYYLTANRAVNGAANVTFKGTTDNTIQCNNVTDFYRLIVDKGVDQTYILNLTSTNVSNFTLYAPNDQATDFLTPPATTFNPINFKALWIKNGTLKLEGYINIPSLTENGAGDYFVPLNACFWINSPNVAVTSTTGMVTTINIAFKVAGKFRISSGSLNTASGSGFNFYSTCEVLIEGGTVSCAEFRPSNIIDSPQASYTQTGGTINTTVTFSLPFTTNTFIMSGGTINLNGTTQALFGCLPGNYNVTGGTINFNINGNANCQLATTVPFYDMNINHTSAGTGKVLISSLTTPNPSFHNIPLSSLVILHNLKIVTGNNAELNTANQDLTIGGLLDLQTGTVLTPGTNSLYFNGNGVQTFNNSGTITGGQLNKLKLINTSDLSLTGSNLSVADTLSIGAGCIFHDNGLTVSALGNIVNNGTHFKPASGAGSIQLTGTNAQIISGNGTGSFNNLTLNKTGGSVLLNSDMTITGDIRLAGTAGTWSRLNIGSNTLTMDAPANVYDALAGSTQNFNSNRMILTTGLMSDGGIAKKYNTTNAFLFPYGFYNLANTTYYYMPATIQFSVVPTQYGTVVTRPVNSRHPLAIGTNNALTCYWKTSSTGFVGIPSGSVVNKYYYDFAQSNYFVQGAEISYIPAVFRNSNAWATINNVNNVNDATNQILYDTAYNANGEYTSGLPAAFTAIPVLYSATSGSWTNAATWSATAVGGTGGAGIPGPNTIVVIGDATHNNTISVTANDQSVGSLSIAPQSVLDIGITNGHVFTTIPINSVTGAGKLRIASSGYFPSGDFGDFIKAGGGTVEYYTSATGPIVTVPTTSASGLILNTYNNLILSPSSGYCILLPNTDLTIFGNTDINGGGTGANDGVRTIGTSHIYTINGNLNVNSGLLSYMNGVIQTIRVFGNTIINAGAIFNVQNTGMTVNNILELRGNLTSAGTFNMFNTNRVITNFTGTNNQTISGSGTIGFYSLNENKGNDATSILTVNSTITTGFTEPFVNLTNGTFRCNSPGIINLTQNSNFTVPASACLSIQQGTVNIVTAANDNDLILTGKLEVLGGTLNIGNSSNVNKNDIEYGSAGWPEIDVVAGNLNVNGQIRRNLSNTSGSLIFNQSGGDVTILGKAFDNTRAFFEIANIGSRLILTGGNITIRNSGSNVYGDVYLRPDFDSITGGTLLLGDATTIAGNNFSVISSSPIWNVSVGNAARTQTATLNILPFTVLNNLLVNGNSVFNANGLDVSIGNTLSNGNANAVVGIVNGGYQSGTSTQSTLFTGPSSQISGIAGNLTNFANLRINGNTTLPTNSNIAVKSTLSLNSGTFSDMSNIVSSYGNIINTAIHVSSSVTGGIYLVGSTPQTIKGIGGVFGNVNINNTNGVNMVDNEIINGVLTFTNGSLYIDDYLLTLGANATIAGVCGVTKKILLNGVVSDHGVNKLFPAGASPAFTYPIGVAGKYTPVTYTVSNCSTAGSITVVPVGGANPADFDSPNNELSYYWNVTGTGLTSPTITQQYNYVAGDVTGTETSYVSGIYNKLTNTWASPAGGTVNSGAHTINFTSISTITGEYTCGYNTNFNNKPTLYSIALTGNWSNGSTWSLTSGGPACGCTPNGNPIVIPPANTVIVDVNLAKAFSMDLVGTMDVGTTMFNSFGHISGAGKLKISSTVDGIFIFPAGDYTDFMANTSSIIEFAGNNTAMLPLKPGNIYKAYQNVIFSGTGLKQISAENIQVNGSLTILNGATLSDDLFDENVIVQGDWIDQNTVNNGFIPGTGMVTLQGSSLQKINVGKIENFYDLAINNSNNVTLRNGSMGINISDKLYLNNGDFLTKTGQELTISNTASSGVVIGGGVNSYVDGPMVKNIITGQSFNYPLGSGGRFAPAIVSNTSASTSPALWTATFSNLNPNTINPAATLGSPLTSISNNEYWTIGRPVSGVANVGVTWDGTSYPGITSDPVVRNNLRIAEYDGTSNWSQAGQLVNASKLTVSTTVPVVTNNYIFTLGVAGVTANLSLSTVPNICNNGAVASIPVDFTGIPDYSLTYKVTNIGNSAVKTFSLSGISGTTFNIQISGADLASIALAGTNSYRVQLLTITDNTGTSGSVLGTTQFSVLLTNTPSITGAFTVGSTEVRSFSTIVNGTDTYLWDWNGGSSGGTITSLAINITNITMGGAGAYQLRMRETSAATGCVASDIKTITVNNVPTPNITPRTVNICKGVSQLYTTPAVGAHTYTWTVVGGTPASGSGNTINVTWNTVGAGSISVDENNAGTHGSDIVNVVVDPNINTGLTYNASSLSICAGTSANIQVLASQANMNYQLMNGAILVGSPVVGNGATINLPTGNLISTTAFTVNVSNNSCSGNLTQAAVSLTVNPMPVTGPVYHK